MFRFIVPAIILSGVLLSSCRSTRKIQTAISKKDTAVSVSGNAHEDTVQLIHDTYVGILKNHIDFKTFSKIMFEF